MCSIGTPDIQNILETSEPRLKQIRRPEPRKHTLYSNFGYLGVFNLDCFRKCTKESPFIFFEILQLNGCLKISMGPPFTFFDAVQNSIFIFLKIFSMSPIGCPKCLLMFCNKLEFQNAQRVPH